MSASIKIDIYAIFWIPLSFVFMYLASVRDKLLRNGCVRWLTNVSWGHWILLLILDIYWVLFSWLISIRIYNWVNKLDEHIGASNRCSCFFEEDWRESQIELMNAIPNLTCFSMAKLHYRVTNKLLFSIFVCKSLDQHIHGLLRFLCPIFSMEVHFHGNVNGV